jgi:hypothetical protein
MRLRHRTLTLAALAPLSGLASAASMSDTLSEVRESLIYGKPTIYLRYRLESVEQDPATGATLPNREAHASTMRLAVGYGTKPWKGLSGYVQYEGVIGAGNEMYNSGNNGLTQYPVVSDHAETVELQQAFGLYAPAFAPRAALKLGRQDIVLDNQRFVGTVGWRQDWQSFDAATLTSSWVKNLTLHYSYLDRVHRILPEDAVGGEVEMDGHLANAGYKVPDLGTAGLYAYLLDFDRNPAFVAQSTATYGARFAGAYKVSSDWSALYHIEAAMQEDYAENTLALDNNYYAAELGASFKGIALKGGAEILEGRDTAGNRFMTPLATLHAFNGWADMFLATPNAGLRDLWVSLGGPIAVVDGLRFAAIYHDFTSDNGDARFGDEIDLLLEYAVRKFDPNLVIGLKYADYRADEGEGATTAGGSLNADTTKTWGYAQYSF